LGTFASKQLPVKPDLIRHPACFLEVKNRRIPAQGRDDGDNPMKTMNAFPLIMMLILVLLVLAYLGGYLT
jgi:hypothetical protein